MTRFVFVRHGESESNISADFTGSMDIALSEKGLLQAGLTAELLKDTRIDAAYASDLKRAFVTGERIAERHGVTVVPDRALREIFGGDWEGVPYAELAERWPEEYDNWKRHPARCRCPGGESIADVYRRVVGEVERLAEKHDGQTVLIATHATPIRVMKLRMLGLPLSRMGEVKWASNASVTVADYDGGCWRIVLDGADDHLSAVRTELPKTI